MFLARALMRTGASRPIELVGTAASNSGAFSFASGAVSGAQAKDLQLLMVSRHGGGSGELGPIAGWTTVFDDITASIATNVSLYYRYLASSDVSVTSPRAVDSAAITAVLRNAEYVSQSSSAQSVATPPAVSMRKGDWSVVLCYSADDTTLVSAPSGYGSRHGTVNGAAARQPGACIAFKEITVAGTEAPGAFTGLGLAANYRRTTTIRLKRD